MVQTGSGDKPKLDDGEDERMLGSEEKENFSVKKDEVKFISGDQQNGDAKIDIGNLDKAFTGMTKEELMKYANDPFWIRLRWIFFVLFWLIWAGMLVGAIFIIINAPKCAAPTPLEWYKQGPLIKFKSALDVTNDDLNKVKKLDAKGAIYELPAEHTYLVKEPEIENQIKDLIEKYKDTNTKVILDITPNYVTKDSKLFVEALENPHRRASFVWIEGSDYPDTWRSIVNGSAWHEVKSQNYVLSQFGEGKYDLFMNDSFVKQELKNVLLHLIKLGVKGFRLTNAKHFIVNKDLRNETPNNLNNANNFTHDQYGFWTHVHSTFLEGLGDYLNELRMTVKGNSTVDVESADDNEVFLSVSEDTIRPEVFKTKSDTFGIDIPIYGVFTNVLERKTTSDNTLYKELNVTMQFVGQTTWLQWIYNSNHLNNGKDPSAYYIFMSLLPGTPVLSANSAFLNLTDDILSEIKNLRSSPSYMHGGFNIYESGQIIAYSRIKSGNPGYFVVFNPSETYAVGNFSSYLSDLPDKMTYHVLSHNYNITGIEEKAKVSIDAVEMSPFSTVILTYVPVKKN